MLSIKISPSLIMNIHDIHHDRERKQNKTVYLTVLFESFCCGVYVGSHKLFLISSIVIVIKRVCACHIALIYSDDLQCINISLHYRDLQTIGSFKNPTMFWWNVWERAAECRYVLARQACTCQSHRPGAQPTPTGRRSMGHQVLEKSQPTVRHITYHTVMDQVLHI